MKKSAWIVSGLGLVIVWPLAGMMTAFAYDAPTVPRYFAFVRVLLAVTLYIIPLIWILAFILSIVEARRKMRDVLLKRYAMAPYFAAGAHLLVWVAAFAGMD